MSGAAPQCGQTKLGIRVHGWLFEDAFAWVEELTNEGKVESWLPFLNNGHFKTAIVGAFGVDGDGCPNVEVVMFTPIAQCQFCMDKPVLGELKIFAGSAIFTIQSMVHRRPNIEFGLQVWNMGETDVDALGLKEWSREKVVGMEGGTP